MKKILIINIILLIAVYLYSDIFTEIKNKFEKEYVDPLTKDLTGVTCNGILNHSDALGWFNMSHPVLGVNFRSYVPMKKVSENLKDIAKGLTQGYIFLPVAQLEKGLPWNIDIIFRGIGYGDILFLGGGLKYSFLKLPPVVPVIHFSVAGFYNVLSIEEVLSLNSMSLNTCISLSIPVIKPYVVIGYDRGNLTIDKKFLDTRGLQLSELKGEFSGSMRYEAGLNLYLLPFVYINCSYSHIYGDEGFSAGLGITF